MEKDDELAYSEVDEILSHMEDKYVEKIPQKVKDFFKQEKNKEYKPIIDVNVPLEQQNLKRETIILLAILNLNYWCDSEEEKEKLLNDFMQNQELKEIELREKYNPDNLFKKKNARKDETLENDKNVQLIEYKEQNFIQKLFHKIMKLFKKN